MGRFTMKNGWFSGDMVVKSLGNKYWKNWRYGGSGLGMESYVFFHYLGYGAPISWLLYVTLILSLELHPQVMP